MNIDILKKLIALANNNPNDHEANSAARRVCKMLQEAMDSGQLNFKSKAKIYRTPEPEFKSKPPYPGRQYGDPVSSSLNAEELFELMRKIQEEEKRKYREGSWEGFSNDPHEYSKTYDYETIFRDPPNRSWVDPEKHWAGNPKRKMEKRELECTVCHQVKSTVFVGHSSQYRCGDCIGKK